MSDGLTALELGRIASALSLPTDFAYAPPHVFPMSVPQMQSASGAARRPAPGRPLGVYLHVPFCRYACAFCSYAKKIGAPRETMARLTLALERELEAVEPGTPLTQLYVGGGTPTALPAELLERAIEAVQRRMRPAADVAHTVECSPESLTAEHVGVFERRGIRRVSIGIQSFDDAILRRIGRDHSGAEARAACELLVSPERIVNADLIYGLPGQSPESVRSDVATLAAAGVDSFTLYNLRVNERTPIAGRLQPEERLTLERLVRWRTLVRAIAADCGFEQTRWHAFRRKGLASWKAAFADLTSIGDQLGAGNSARSRLRDTIYRNHPSLEVYLERIESGASPVEEAFVMDRDQQRLRFLAVTLGDGAPLDRAEYQSRFGTAFLDDFTEPMLRRTELGLVQDVAERVSLTDKGKLIYDLATLAFYPAAMREWLGQRRERVATRLRANGAAGP